MKRILLIGAGHAHLATLRALKKEPLASARLAPYEYPREIEFIDALPMTTTGKVQRKELRRREEANLKA